jgi:L-asparaginase/Glu-tRNA(Gln) amidotransferase subunit D
MSNNKIRVAICNCGGTIFSHISKDGTIALNSPESVSNSQIFRLLGDVEFDEIVVPLYSSENATVNDYRLVFKGIIEYFDSNRENTNCLMIMHGTDSMAYFAQLAYRALSFIGVPVVIVGSKFTPDTPGSDAFSNVKEAIRILLDAVEGKSQVFKVVFSHSKKLETESVNAWQIEDADIDGDYGCFESRPIAKTDIEQYEKRARAFIKRQIGVKDRVLTIHNSPSFPFSSVVIDRSKIGAILIQSFHSGTANSAEGEGSLVGLVSLAGKEGIKSYIAPVVAKNNNYESESILRKIGVIPCLDVPIEGAWAEIVL